MKTDKIEEKLNGIIRSNQVAKRVLLHLYSDFNSIHCIINLMSL